MKNWFLCYAFVVCSALDEGSVICNNQVGLVSPLSLCNQTIAPLTHCAATPGAEVLNMSGINGITRPYCRITPSSQTKVPLVFFFHGALGSGDGVVNETNLVNAARTWQWSGGGAAGFVLVSPSGACLNWPRAGSRPGSHWDFYHQDLGSPSSNPDVALADAIIDAEVARGTVDPDRIFVMGWSNGGFFGQMYAIARSAVRGTPTKGGNHVAATSVYTAGDSFNNLNFNTTPSCQLDPYPQCKGARIMVTSNDCDLVPCDAQQGAELDAAHNSSLFEAPGFDVKHWVGNSSSLIGASLRWDLLDAFNQDNLAKNGCRHGRLECTPLKAIIAHSTWPSGRLSDMLNFLNAGAVGKATMSV